MGRRFHLRGGPGSATTLRPDEGEAHRARQRLAFGVGRRDLAGELPMQGGAVDRKPAAIEQLLGRPPEPELLAPNLFDKTHPDSVYCVQSAQVNTVHTTPGSAPLP